MVGARITTRPVRFDRVDRVKLVVGDPVLPGDDRFWILGSPLVADADGDRIEIPTGFTTDGASVPDWAQWITMWKPWEDPQRWAGIVHDWLYTQRGVTKKYADQVFRSVLDSEGTGRFRRTAMYAAVVVGGGRAYRANQERGPRIYNRERIPELAGDS